jgi:hypothetical protein
MSVIISKIWLVIGGGPINARSEVFGNQLYYMSHGPYMSHEMYFIQGAGVAVASAFVYLFYVRSRKIAAAA